MCAFLAWANVAYLELTKNKTMNISSVLSSFSAADSLAVGKGADNSNAASGDFADVLRAAGAMPSSATGSETATLRPEGSDDSELKQQFTNFVGQTLFGQLFKTMRESLDKPAYFHGGQTEEIFQQQLDQVLTERMTSAQGGQIAETMYNLQFGSRSQVSFDAEL